jgi:hypothetical protein
MSNVARVIEILTPLSGRVDATFLAYRLLDENLLVTDEWQETLWEAMEYAYDHQSWSGDLPEWIREAVLVKRGLL